MLKYETLLLPLDDEQETTQPDWTPAFVIRSLIGNDLDAERLIRFDAADYQGLLVAYAGEEIYGLQLMDYDPVEMNIVLGKQIISAALSSAESDFLQEDLAARAKASYEDLF